MRAWWELYKKEIYSIGFFTMVVLLLLFAWEFFLFYKSSAWPLELTFGLSFLPFSFFPLLILWLGYNAYRQEWKDDSNYFILSIPRRGWEISLAKLTSSMSFYIVVTLLTSLLIYLFNQEYINTVIIGNAPACIFEDNLVSGLLMRSLLVYWLTALAIYVITQFSQLISLYFDRFRGLVTVIVFIVTHYIIFRGAVILSPLFNWLPDFPVKAVNEGMGLVQRFTFYIGSGPIIASTLLIIALFFFGSWLLEHQLEV